MKMQSFGKTVKLTVNSDKVHIQCPFIVGYCKQDDHLKEYNHSIHRFCFIRCNRSFKQKRTHVVRTKRLTA